MKKMSLLILLISFTFTTTYESSIVGGDLLFEAQRIVFYQEIKDKDFSEDLLIQCLYFEGIQHPDIVIRQARLETGNYTSELFWCANNVFGMKFPRVRETTATGIYKRHARYKHWSDAVRDYRLWQEYYILKGYSPDDYYLFLAAIGYAMDKNYIKKIS